MTNLKIDLFGEFRVRRGESLIEGEEWDRRKTRQLLKLLLTRPERPFSRDEILDALWPDASPTAAERSLWVTVSLLRRALEPGLARGSDSRYVVRRRPGYAFDSRAGCEVDAWEFDRRCEKAEAARQSGELNEAIREYRGALDLVRGEFLAEDLYEEWAARPRQRYRERHLSALEGLSECLARKGRYTEAIEFCDRALELDRYREELYRRLMLYHYCAGEQGLALRAYRDYSGRLEKELDAAPSPELARLRKQMEARDVPGVDELRRYPRPRRPLRLPYSLGRVHFAGRDGEYALLAERLREAAAGAGGAVAVEGEAGVGKTRLVEEFLGYARSRRALVLSGRCFERELGAPLEPVLDAVAPLLDTEEARSALGASLPIAGESGERAREQSARLYRSLTGRILDSSRSGDGEALVIFVDDVQWADPATLDYLTYFAGRAAGERVLLIFTYRREDAPALSGWLRRLAEKRAVSTTLSLDRLSREDLAGILERMSSRDFAELSALADFLHRESEGNPFYAVEYLRWLIETGVVRTDSRRRISALEGDALRERALPSGVQTLIGARLHGLEEAARGLLELAAVVGRAFDLGLLCAAADRGEAEVFAVLEPVMAAGLMLEAGERGYYFSHDKFRQALYEGLDAPRRRKLHLRIAETLREKGGDPAELAHHYLRAREWEPALENLLLAARGAEERYAWEAALQDYDRALEAAEKIPDSGEERFGILAARERLLEHLDRREKRAEAVGEMFHLATEMGEPGRIGEVQIRRMGALAALGDAAGSAEVAREAIAIFRRLNDRDGEARVHREAGYVRWLHRDYEGALEANFEALRLHRETGDRHGEAGAAGNIAQVYRGMGDQERALEWAEEAAGIHRELGDRIGEGMRLTTMAAIHRERGELQEALSLNRRTLRYNDEAGARHLNVAQHSTCGTLYLELGDARKALHHFRAAARLAREIGHTRDEGRSSMSVGVALEGTGDPAGAADAYRRAAELLHVAHAESGEPEDLSARAEALTLLATVLHRSLDLPADALEPYEEASRFYRELSGGWRLGALLSGLAGARWRTGDAEGSAAAYEEALDLASGDAALRLVCLASLCAVYRETGRLRESLRRGREACSLARELGDARTEARVLASLAESYDRLGHYPSALSCLRRSLRLRRREGDGPGAERTLRYMATIHERRKETERPEARLEEARREEAREFAPESERSS